MSAITVRDLSKSYGDLVALRGVSFDVHEGEVLAVLGPNGAGKTTMVEILEGYRPRTSGAVDVLGFDPTHGGRAMRERIGIVLQQCDVDRYLSVREVLTMYGGYYPKARPVDELLDLVGLQEKATSRVKTLSGGQRRRLDLALGLVGDPELLFLDEPTTGFDPSARRTAWELVRNLRALGKTILLTTHYMDEAQVLADRVIVIAQGAILADGPPESIGGRSAAAARIRFRLPGGADAADLPLAGWSLSDGEVVLETAEPTKALHALTAWAVARAVELESLEVTRPSLEDVYLKLVEEGDS